MRGRGSMLAAMIVLERDRHAHALRPVDDPRERVRRAGGEVGAALDAGAWRDVRAECGAALRACGDCEISVRQLGHDSPIVVQNVQRQRKAR